MTTVTPDKVKRTPRTPESITNGALSLPLEDRVKLMKELEASIKKEVEDLTERAKNAASISGMFPKSQNGS